jgi:hypothetical protein
MRRGVPTSHFPTRDGAAVLLAVVLAFAIPPVGFAAEAEAPLILHLGAAGGGLTPAMRVEVAQRLGYAEAELPAAEPFLDVALQGALLWPRNAAAQACLPGTPTFPLPPVIEAAERALVDLRHGDALGLLSPVVERLACVEDPVDGATLARAVFLLGYARFLGGDRTGAEQAFGMAAVLDPDIAWDNDYPPEVQQTFNNAVLEALRARAGSVGFSEEFWRRTEEVRIDGRAVAANGVVGAGLHRLTLPSRDQAGVPVAIRFEPEQVVYLWPVEDLVSGLVAGDELGEVAKDALVAALVDRGREQAIVVEPSSRRMYRFGTETRQLREIQPLKTPPGGDSKPVGSRVARRALPQPTPGATLIIVGTITAIVGMSIGLALEKDAREMERLMELDPDEVGRLSDDYDRTVTGMTISFVAAGFGGASIGIGIPVAIEWAKDRGATQAALTVTTDVHRGALARTSLAFSARW